MLDLIPQSILLKSPFSSERAIFLEKDLTNGKNYDTLCYVGQDNYKIRSKYYKEIIIMKNETSKDRFKRLAELRTNEVLKRLRILGNCSNRQMYEYTRADIEKIFSTIDKKIKETKLRFHFPKEEKFKL